MSASTSNPALVRIAVDIGGTFTDGVAEFGHEGRILTAKVLTTPKDPSLAVAQVTADLIGHVSREASVPPSQVHCTDIVHGTTLITNAIIERRGAKTGLVVTRGTRDTLLIAREIRYDSYDLDIELPEPLVPTELIFEADERLNAEGRVLLDLSQASIDGLIAAIEASGVEAVGVCLLHAHVNPRHEEAIAAALAERLPAVAVSISSRVSAEMREYERMSTIAANAYVQPLATSYIRRLRRNLDEVGAKGPLRIMISSGGFVSDTSAAEAPIVLLESGPAGGVVSGVNTAGLVGVTKVLTFDMGGTTAKACVAVDSAPSITYLFEAARTRRFKRGSGLPILIPSIDLIEIGAGGGSIAFKSSLGLLNVGPQSSGAEPGPACYGLGGLDPTVTDADLVLGYLDPQNFLGGRMRLDKGLAERAIGALAEKLDLSMLDIAWGICDLVNENMASAARVHVAEKGLDPRSLTMAATGGAGPVHAVEIAHKLGISRVLCTVAAGVGSCLGFLAAPARSDRALASLQLLDAVDVAAVAKRLDTLKGEVTADLRAAGVADADMEFTLGADIRYAGQGHAIVIEQAFAGFTGKTPARYRELFLARYVELYGQAVPGALPQVVTWRLTGRSARQLHEFVLTSAAASKSSVEAAKLGSRAIYLPERKAFAEVPVYRRDLLPRPAKLAGPLLLQEAESTVVVARSADVEILPNGTVSIVMREGEGR